MTKISALSDIGTSVAPNDAFVLVDVSDPTTPNKKIQQQNLFLIPDGSAGTPAVRFLNDTDVGLFRPTTNTLALATGGSERLRIDSSGQVGIGTTSPRQALTFGGLTSSSTSTPDCIDLGATYTSTSASTNLKFKLYVDSSGNTYGFTVNGSSHLEYYAGTVSSPGNHVFFTGGSERVRIDSSGRLGIGTTNPDARLTVQDGTNNILRAKQVAFDNYINEGIGITFGRTSDGVDTMAIGVVDGNKLIASGRDGILFATGGAGLYSAVSESARIDSSGRLLVGTSSAFDIYTGLQVKAVQPATGAHLDLQANFASTIAGQGAAIIRFLHSDSAYRAYILCESDGASSGSSDAPGRLVFSTTADGASSPTERMKISSAGAVSIENGSFVLNGTAITSGAGTNALKWNSATGLVTYDSSSRLIKDKIADCPYGINAIKRLQPRKYFRLDDQREEVGFIADEVASVMPEFVPVGPKSVITGNTLDLEIIPLGVNYDKLTAVLTSALQEAVAKIESLEARLTAAGI